MSLRLNFSNIHLMAMRSCGHASAHLPMSANACAVIRVRSRSECRHSADSVEKQRVAVAESVVLNRATTSVLGGCGEEEFVICTAWAA